MKCSEYLWKYLSVMQENPDISPEQAQGELRAALGAEGIENDVTGEAMTEREAKSVYGRKDDDLRRTFGAGDQELFTAIVAGQLTLDAEGGEEE